MNPPLEPLNLQELKVFPLTTRKSESRLDDILVDPGRPPANLKEESTEKQIGQCAEAIRAARQRGAGVMLFYGAHLIKNGGQLLVNRLISDGWVNHVGTNGAGIIHDWEFAHLGWSTESVRENVATGTFGTWDETGRHIHLALLTGGVKGEGFGRSIGRLIQEDGVELPDPQSLKDAVAGDPANPRTAARAELLQAMNSHRLSPGRHRIDHPHKASSVPANAYTADIPLTVHPGIGYDIISNHPMFNGAAIGRAAAIDFRLTGSVIDHLDGGVVLSIGSAIMAPQVFEKSISCVNNLRRQRGERVVDNHQIYVVDIQDGGHWDWSRGEPPKENPAYYLRFCKSFSRMGGQMHYCCCDNVRFLHHLLRHLTAS